MPLTAWVITSEHHHTILPPPLPAAVPLNWGGRAASQISYCPRFYIVPSGHPTSKGQAIAKMLAHAKKSRRKWVWSVSPYSSITLAHIFISQVPLFHASLPLPLTIHQVSLFLFSSPNFIYSLILTMVPNASHLSSIPCSLLWAPPASYPAFSPYLQQCIYTHPHFLLMNCTQIFNSAKKQL